MVFYLTVYTYLQIPTSNPFLKGKLPVISPKLCNQKKSPTDKPMIIGL
jgi:hypothetical protein